MNTNEGVIIITGAAGFIGSNMARALNSQGFQNLILVDEFIQKSKDVNWQSLTYIKKIDRALFLKQIKEDTFGSNIHFVIHLGARTDTTEQNKEVLDALNLEYSKAIWAYCTHFQIPLIYASSAATYGNGEWGYSDDISPYQLTPLNLYGESKNDFDAWILKQENCPPFWYGLKFFNVFGPYEQHKGRMASVVYHAFHQIKNQGQVKLFKSHHPDYEDGEQKRDFVYVKDVVKVISWLTNNKPKNGIYNLGTGYANTFKDLVKYVFKAMKLPEQIEMIDTPEDIREKYQYFTEAKMTKLIDAGYDKNFYSFEDAIIDYVVNHLI